ncbi:MAG TPA: HDIG domain-containing protein [Methanocorpusculum sp.]|nr:HDIG domain-containing protein [Methanocorpusculum sp.]
MKTEKYTNILFNAGCDIGVVNHCLKVAEVASEFSGISVDDELVLAGSILHDLGRSRTHTIEHASVGAELSEKLGFSKEITEIIRCHTGAGLSADECTLLGLEPTDCIPQTLEEKIVANADNLVKGSRVITIYERVMLIFDLPRRSKKNIRRLAMDIGLLSK